MSKINILMVFLFFSACQSFAQFYDGRSLQETSLDQLTARIQPGSILFLGENHGLAAHRDQHLEILKALKAQGLKVSVGLEFINYTDQSFVNSYRAGSMDETAFLNSIKWRGVSFDFYRQQLNFPDIKNNEYSLGLNIPMGITSKISKTGLSSLTSYEASLLPPNFTVGRDSYKARFMEAAGAHCKNAENCFVAQSAWDDTMAWQAVQFIQQHPDQVLVIVVGEFHVQYGGGFPSRVQARSPQTPLLTVSQIWAEGFTSTNIQQELQPSPLEGPRADFIWVSKP